MSDPSLRNGTETGYAKTPARLFDVKKLLEATFVIEAAG